MSTVSSMTLPNITHLSCVKGAPEVIKTMVGRERERKRERGGREGERGREGGREGEREREREGGRERERGRERRRGRGRERERKRERGGGRERREGEKGGREGEGEGGGGREKENLFLCHECRNVGGDFKLLVYLGEACHFLCSAHTQRHIATKLPANIFPLTYLTIRYSVTYFCFYPSLSLLLLVT